MNVWSTSSAADLNYICCNPISSLWSDSVKLKHPVVSYCCRICREPWICGGGAGGARAEGDITGPWPVGRCQRCRRRPEKPSWWQIQPHPGLRQLLFLCFLFLYIYFFSFNHSCFKFFEDKNTPHHCLPPHQHVTVSSCPPPSRAVTSMDSHVLSLHPQTFCLILFFYWKKKTVDKSTLCISHTPPISAHPVVHRACWERHDMILACPSFLPLL